MNCRLFKMLIQRYHDGELGLGEMAEYENHRDGCAECRKLDAEFIGVFAALGGIGHFEPSPQFNAKVMAQVNVARYRVPAWKKGYLSVRGFWRGLPSPVQATGIIASVFAVFVGIYTPFLMMMASAARTLAGYAMSGIYLVRRILDDPDILMNYLISMEKYRVAGRILIKTIQRQSGGIPLIAFILTAAAAAVILYAVFRGTLGLWKKGETHVGIL